MTHKTEMYSLPDGTLTGDPIVAAELWEKAFYQAKDVLARFRPIPSLILNEMPIRDLEEIIKACDRVLSLGDH